MPLNVAVLPGFEVRTAPPPLASFPRHAYDLPRPAPAFPGFEERARSVPVPAPLLGEMLAEIADDAELRCVLRFLWHQAQVPGSPKRVPAERMRTDGVLLAALGSEERVERGVRLALGHGLLIEADGWLLLNTPQNRRSAGRLERAPETTTAAPSAAERPNVFQCYEENIGMLTPMIADELMDAEKAYPVGWVEDAIREAVASNARSWRYIAAVLERWQKEGRGEKESKGEKTSGKLSGHTQTLTPAELFGLTRRS